MPKNGTWWPPNVQARRERQCWQKYEKCKWAPVTHPKSKDATYFNNRTKRHLQIPIRQYDLYFSFTRFFPIYDQRKNREDASCINDIRENIFLQESRKAVPLTTSQTYGKRQKQLDQFDRQFNHSDHIGLFYRRNGAFPVIEKEIMSNNVMLGAN